MRRNSENKIGAHLMQVIAPRVADVRLQGSDGRLAFTPNPRSTLASGERALQATQLARVGLGDVGSTNPLTIGERGKACQSKVNAEAGAVHLLGGLDLNVEHDVPLAGHLPACRVRMALVGALGNSRCQRTLISPGTPTSPSLPLLRIVSPSPTRKSAAW